MMTLFTIPSTVSPTTPAGPVRDAVGDIVGWRHGKKPITLMRAAKQDVDPIIAANHYSGKACRNSFCSLLVYYGDHGVQGAVQIGYGIRPKLKQPGVVEFDRMWLDDIMPKYSETIVLSLVHKYLRHVYPEVHTLRSYADMSAGNSGTIYRAGNYTETKRLKADFYILPDGERVHPVTMWHRHGTRKKSFLDVEYPGWKKADGEQIQYQYQLRKPRTT